MAFTKKHEFYFASSDNVTKIHAVCWIPKQVDYILQISHGMLEYIDRYEDFAKYLNKFNILVVGNDHLGHGFSVLSEDKYGYFSEKNGNKVLIKDMYKLSKLIKAKYPHRPYIFLGHSMGSFLLRQFLYTYPYEANKAIIVGTGYNYTSNTRALKRIVKSLGYAKGDEYKSYLINQLMNKLFNFGFDFNFNFNNKNKNNTGLEWLTRDKEEILKYLANNKSDFLFTLNGYYNLFNAMELSCKKSNIKKYNKSMPILLLSGDRDPVGNFGYGVFKVYRQLKRVKIEDLSYKIYQDYRHEILNEIGKEVVYKDIVSWIKK
ncbi:MAG: alpha/beta hydrolase [bacterium]